MIDERPFIAYWPTGNFFESFRVRKDLKELCVNHGLEKKFWRARYEGNGITVTYDINTSLQLGENEEPLRTRVSIDVKCAEDGREDVAKRLEGHIRTYLHAKVEESKK